MQHLPQSAFAPPTRHARLFELIRQETLAETLSAHQPQAARTDAALDYLKKAAGASLRKRPRSISP